MVSDSESRLTCIMEIDGTYQIYSIMIRLFILLNNCTENGINELSMAHYKLEDK